jgi:hypothetical protein
VGVEVYLHVFLTSALDGGKWSYSRLCTLFPRTASGTRFTEGWVGFKAGMDVVERTKISYHYRKSNPNSSAVKPVAYSFTD